jgi:DNA-binding transcriptional MerR regulator
MAISMQVEVRFKSMGTLTITELSRRTGLAPSALRFYERKSLLEPAGRASGRRIYDEGCVEQVALIDLLKISGFTLGQIATLVDTTGKVSADWRDRVRAKQAELALRLAEIERAQLMLRHTVDCPHGSLHDCPVHRRVVAAHARSLAGAG